VRKGAIAAVALACLLVQAGGALAGPAPVPLAATYQPSMPPSMGAASDTIVAVVLTNTGDETWKSFAPPETAPKAGQIALSYHWYDQTGATLAWDGLRTSVGADVPPQGTRTVNAQVRVPTAPGTYLLRFALIKEGVAWFPPSQPFPVQVTPA
jgi:hypothetical protein